MPYPDALPTIHGITVTMHRHATMLPRYGVRAQIATRRSVRHSIPSGRHDGVVYHRWVPPLATLAGELLKLRTPWFPNRYLNLEIAAVHRLARLLRPDLLHVREPYGAFTGIAIRERLGIPFVVSLHTFSPLYHERLDHGRPVHSDEGARWTQRFLDAQEKIPLVIAVSTDVAERYVAQGLSRSRVRVIPDGVPDAFFSTLRSTLLHRRFRFDAGHAIILVVGRLEASKGQRDAIDAFAKVRPRFPRLRLVLLGGGADYELREAEDLRRHAGALGVAPDVAIGSVPPDQMPPAMASATLVVVATRLYEGFGLPVAEAAAAGRPVVATRVGGLPELVDDRVTGLLVPPCDPDAMAAAIEELLRDAALRERMGSEARASAAVRFSLERSVAAHVDAYRAVLGPRASSSP